jgi:galactose mutarotase-like enzyme
VDELSLQANDLGARAEGGSAAVRTLKTGLSDGVMSVRLDNGEFSLDVLPTRGMGIWKAWLGKEEIGWQSPVKGPVHPCFVPMSEPSGLGWLDGFDELLCRCGLESNGAPEFDEQGRLKYPLHGRIANRPAHFAELAFDDATSELSLTGEVDEVRFHFLKLRLRSTVSLKLGERGFRVRDEVLNLSRSPAEAQMLYHVNFGRPLLDAGSRLVTPARRVVPRNARAAEGIRAWDSYAAEQPAFAEQVYFLELHGDSKNQTQVLLKNAHGTRGVSMRFNTRQLPRFTVWKNTTSIADGYVTGLEPGTNFPNPRGFEGRHGRMATLPPGGSTVFELQIQAHGTPTEVEAAETAIAELQSQPAQVLDQPHPDWCAP